jgi:hypothetical protein
MDDSPLARTIEVSGLLADARHVRRKLQVEACRRGPIPFIPEDPSDDSNEELAVARIKPGSASRLFKVGDRVRVKQGVSDPDFPDMALGGWTGTITEVLEHKGKINCIFELDERTLASIHPIFKRRCEIEGLDHGFMALGQEDIEPDDGTLFPIEQPRAIVPRPLSPNDEFDRIRMALGLTHDDLIPDVTRETLLAYRRYLATHLTFPILVTSWEKSGPFVTRKVTIAILALVEPEGGGIDEVHGLIGLGRSPTGQEIELPLDEIELGRKDPNRRLLADYSSWFQNWR